jgi:hypothetical protein
MSSNSRTFTKATFVSCTVNGALRAQCTRNPYMGKVNHNPPHIGIVGFPSRCRRSIWRVRLRDAVRERTQSTLYSVRARAPVP